MISYEYLHSYGGRGGYELFIYSERGLEVQCYGLLLYVFWEYYLPHVYAHLPVSFLCEMKQEIPVALS